MNFSSTLTVGFYSLVGFLGGSATPLTGSFPARPEAPADFLLFYTIESSTDASPDFPEASPMALPKSNIWASSTGSPSDFLANLAETHVDRFPLNYMDGPADFSFLILQAPWPASQGV